MDEIQKATSAFRKPYSCAQTIYAAFSGSDDSKLAYYKENSGGRAPENMCGALFAAMELAPESARAEIAAAFAERAGSTNAGKLRQSTKRPAKNASLPPLKSSSPRGLRIRRAVRLFCICIAFAYKLPQTEI